MTSILVTFILIFFTLIIAAGYKVFENAEISKTSENCKDNKNSKKKIKCEYLEANFA